MSDYAAAIQQDITKGRETLQFAYQTQVAADLRQDSEQVYEALGALFAKQ